MFHFVFIAEAKTFVRSARSGCHHGPNLLRYSCEFIKPLTIVREEPGLASRNASQFRYKASGSRLRYPKYSVTTNAWLKYLVVTSLLSTICRSTCARVSVALFRPSISVCLWGNV